MVYVGAIANGGKAAVPRLIDSVKFNNGFPSGYYLSQKTRELIKPETAATLTKMMHNDVVETYGESNFPGLDLCAKSGTAEVGGNRAPNACFETQLLSNPLLPSSPQSGPAIWFLPW